MPSYHRHRDFHAQRLCLYPRTLFTRMTFLVYKDFAYILGLCLHTRTLLTPRDFAYTKELYLHSRTLLIPKDSSYIQELYLHPRALFNIGLCLNAKILLILQNFSCTLRLCLRSKTAYSQGLFPRRGLAYTHSFPLMDSAYILRLYLNPKRLPCLYLLLSRPAGTTNINFVFTNNATVFVPRSLFS